MFFQGLSYNFPLPSLGERLYGKPKEHHEDANTCQWPTLLGNFVLPCSLIIQNIIFFKKSNRTVTILFNTVKLCSSLPQPQSSLHKPSNHKNGKDMFYCKMFYFTLNQKSQHQGKFSALHQNCFVILKYSFLVMYKKDLEYPCL